MNNKDKNERSKMKKQYDVYYENDIKITKIPMKKIKSSNIIKTKFHKKAKRANFNNGPSMKIISGIYGDDKQLDGKLQHRGRNPLAAQENRAVENY